MNRDSLTLAPTHFRSKYKIVLIQQNGHRNLQSIPKKPARKCIEMLCFLFLSVLTKLMWTYIGWFMRFFLHIILPVRIIFNTLVSFLFCCFIIKKQPRHKGTIFWLCILFEVFRLNTNQKTRNGILAIYETYEESFCFFSVQLTCERCELHRKKPAIW